MVVVSPSPEGSGEAAGGPARIRSPRELDMTSSAVLVDRVRALDPGAGSVEIDLREVEFIDSFGLRALIEADRILTERSVRPRILVAAEGPVQQLLQLTLLDHTLDVRAE